MGRGRAKAKQTKVARRLKYYSPDTDLTALERELKGSEDEGPSSPALSEGEPDDAAEYHGRNGRTVEDSDPWSRHDEANGAVPEDTAAERQTRPAPNPGSWMKKRA
ncbi:MAG TPA: DUF3073 domain-containing protein [Ornithinimicrobium sp.]|nr:DUF3073 domain-containing protein [Ornithinimicrobium sp.]HKJ11141.1 DUF3073 domain-containing protein [Ornithinimicrobium sp.]